MADHQDETSECGRQRAAEFERVYAEALLGGNAAAAERVISEAIDAGLGEATIDDRVIRPALVLVGDLWADGSITIADEHLATAISKRVLMLQREAFRVARGRSERRVLLAGVQGEQHVVGLEMAASVLTHAGYDVRMFGADLPAGTIGAAVRRHRPDVVGFTTATVLTAVNLSPALEALRYVDRDIGILVGGQGADEHLATVWDVAVCRHVADAVQQVDALVQRAGRN